MNNTEKFLLELVELCKKHEMVLLPEDNFVDLEVVSGEGGVKILEETISHILGYDKT